MRVYLETDRLVLRQFTMADVDNLYELNSDRDVMRFVNGGIPTPRAMIQDDILPGYIEAYEPDQRFGHWAAIEKSSDEFVGWFGLMCREHATSGDLDLGYRLRSSAWNRGYATEGARALIRKCLTDLGARRVLANTYQDNHASRRVMEKAGMRLIRTFRYTPEDILAGRTNHVTTGDLWDGDDVEYAILRTDWERLEAAATSGTGT